VTIGDPGAAAQSEPVQPPEAAENGGPAGDGQGGFGDLYDLSAAPEELRPYLEQELRKVESNVNGKLREAADFRKQWEPFEGVEGLGDIDPDDLKELVQFHEIARDPEAFFQWWGAIAGQVDPNDPQAVETLEQQWEQVGEAMGFFDGDGPAGGDGDSGGFDGLEGDEPPAWAQSLIEDMEALKQGSVQSQEQSRKQEAEQWIASERQRLDPEGQEIDDEAWQVVCRLAAGYDPNDDKALEKAFGDFQRIKGNGQNELVDAAGQRPGPANSGGQPDTSPEKFSGLDDPALKAAVRARFAGKVGT
jgi:hypothetical protein